MNYDTILESLSTFYDQNAQTREKGQLRDWKRAAREQFLHQLQKEGARTLLEVGAGVGRDGFYFQQNGLDVTCTDLSAEMVTYCRAKGLTTHRLDFLQLHKLNKTFDAVYALNSLLHVPSANLPMVLAQIHARLSPNGLFFYGVYGGERFEGLREQHGQQPRFYNYYTDEQIQTIVAKQFELVRFQSTPTQSHTTPHFQAMIWRK